LYQWVNLLFGYLLEKGR